MSINPKYKHFWLAPFLVFFSTYFILHLWFKSESLPMPNISGLHLVEATKLLSQHKLHPEIMQIKEDKDLPEATIIHQTPPAGRMVKQHQTVYVVITEKPAQQKAPYCVGLCKEQIKQIAHAFGLKPKFYYVPYPYLTDHCFAQWPSAGQTNKSKSLICYMAQQEQTMMIIPDFKGKTINEVKAFVELYGVAMQTDIPIESGRNYYIQEQQPKAGAIIDLKESKNITIYLKIARVK